MWLIYEQAGISQSHIFPVRTPCSRAVDKYNLQFTNIKSNEHAASLLRFHKQEATEVLHGQFFQTVKTSFVDGRLLCDSPAGQCDNSRPVVRSLIGFQSTADVIGHFNSAHCGWFARRRYEKTCRAVKVVLFSWHINGVFRTRGTF